MHVMAYSELLLPPSVNQSMFYFMSVNSHQGNIRLKQFIFIFTLAYPQDYEQSV